MHALTSRDGTKIAYSRDGSGPSVVLVVGALDDGSENATLIPALAERFTVVNCARRGRGERRGLILRHWRPFSHTSSAHPRWDVGDLVGAIHVRVGP